MSDTPQRPDPDGPQRPRVAPEGWYPDQGQPGMVWVALMVGYALASTALPHDDDRRAS